MTKRLLALAVCTAMLISLAGCGDKGKKTNKTKAKADSSSIVDDSSTSDSSVSDSSVADVTTVTKPAETNQTTPKVAQTTKTPSKATKPATTVKTTTVAAGCYQAELAKIVGWENKYRPAGSWAYNTYGTRNAQEYFFVVKTAYDFAHNPTLVEKYKNKSTVVSITDNELLTMMAIERRVGETYSEAMNPSEEMRNVGLTNAWYALYMKKGSWGHWKSACVAFAHQMNLKTTLCYGTWKNLPDAWIKLTKSNGSVWYIDRTYMTQSEYISCKEYIATSEDYR